jgi:hypothetical protein
VTLKSIAQNVNLDPIFAKHGAALHRAMEVCNHAIRSVSDDLRTSLAAKLAHRVATDGWRALELDDADYRRWLLPGTTKAMIEKALASVFAGTNRSPRVPRSARAASRKARSAGSPGRFRSTRIPTGRSRSRTR